MKRILFLLSVVVLSFSAGCSSRDDKIQTKKFYIEDDLKNKINFEKIPDRVITLAPNLTEMIFELRQGKKLIGNTKYCNYPPEAKNITKVGDLISVDYEKVVQLKPDLIFITVEGNNKDSYDKLKELGLKVFVSNPRNYEGIKKTIRDMAKIFNVEEVAAKKIKGWDEKVKSVIEKAGSPDSLIVMFIVALQPLMLSGPNTFVNEFIKMCGMKNIAADSPMPYPVYNREEVLLRSPDYILMASDMGFDSKKIVEVYPEWSRLNAVINNKVISVEGDLYFRPGPRFAEALEKLYFTLHSPANQYQKSLQ
ncbi:MAG: cobalamin-binding protein [bacterium]